LSVLEIVFLGEDTEQVAGETERIFFEFGAIAGKVLKGGL
jgi:hypothetical protein